MTGTAIEAAALGKTYGRRGPALDDCSFRLPTGRICAVVGPNGAGKSTLLALAAGLAHPTAGRLTVLGTSPAAARARIAYVAQDKPLHPQLSIADTLRLGAELNPGRWDAECAQRVVAEGELDPGARVRTLSGGQRTRVALALALGKRAELLLLDEPMADLDPLARHQLMGTLMAQAAEHGTTVVMSSHIVGELADSCDHLLLVSGGRIRLGGPIDDLVAAHCLVTGRRPAAELAPHTVVESRATGRGTTALIRPDGPIAADWEAQEPSLEDLLLAHLRSPSAPALLTPDAEREVAR
ncbi:ABC transporter ATP-binding protein [Streptomyces sp. LHD-70]|uniref:ABC transporter ATP-binding protein n=1 Tax=Streptomyces sp. LHD-70 TaxID=3072140 RepID=UPI00280FBD7C|nr:ABC transporter ATP-binding protein [Streptomyces sp. LHD-70]MDQ8704838.1 ABC transporter ATP-binding protein [Streptomyces sp. LHD-70]